MSGIDAPGPRGAVDLPVRRLGRPPQVGFAVTDEASPGAPSRMGAPGDVAGMLALQEVEGAGEQELRQHGNRMLAALAALQRALLGGAAGGTVAELQDLLARLPQGGDPALQLALRAIALRARVELARRDPTFWGPSP